MLNFYRRFLPHAAAHQEPFYDVLSGPRFKGSRPITLTTELLKPFEECKASLPRATLLVHLDPSTPSWPTSMLCRSNASRTPGSPSTSAPKKINPEVKQTAALPPPPSSTPQLTQPQLRHHRHHLQPRSLRNPSCATTATTFNPAAYATSAAPPPPFARTTRSARHILFPARFNG
jgi:hypothetical protein